MVTTLLRIIKYGFQSFKRNGWLSAATILVMVLALAVFASLMLFNVVAKTAIQSLQDKIDISVYFKTSAPEDDILKIERSVQQLPEVKAVEYISRDKALQLFKAKHANDPTIGKALEELVDNPLSASINVKANDPKDYGVIASYLENEKFKDTVDKITYSQNQLAINRLVKIVDTAKTGGTAVTFALALIALIVAFNTVRLAIYSNREEIGIMRLVGGSNMFIRGPYIVEGVIYGVISALAALVVLAPFVHLVAPYMNVFIPEMNIQSYFYGNLFSLLGYELLLGILLGTVSSSIAVTRYLKV